MSNQRFVNNAPHRGKEEILREWRGWFAKRKDDAEYQSGIFRALMDHLLRDGCSVQEEEQAAEMRDTYMETVRRAVKRMESECPIGFFKPSWEQAQILNAWSPDFEPEIAPEGYQSIGIFSANRIGKTCAVCINNLLWILPNDPGWVMFEEHEDPPIYLIDGDSSSGIKRPSRGKYTVRPRPAWERWRRTGKMIYPWADSAPMDPCEIWHGCPTDGDWDNRVLGQFGGKDGYFAWMPRSALGIRSDGGEAKFKQDRKFVLKSGHVVFGKTYNSEDEAWKGKAVRIMAMDEGFDMGKLTESRTRVEAGGYYLWAYTPTEARNIGKKSWVAHQAYSGKVDLVGRAKFFTNFKMEDAPEHILPAEKRQTDMAAFAKLGDEGRSRMCGGFFDSSPAVFSNFSRERNVLPVYGHEVLRAIRGELPTRWTAEFGSARADRLAFSLHQANIIRGMDEGLANPTACVWTAVLRTGEQVTFRDWEQSGLSVGERCEKIIDLSGNHRELINPEAMEERRRYREKVLPTGMTIRRTFADSKMFRRDPLQPSDDWTTSYTKNGLKIERASNLGPGARVDCGNDMLRPDPTRQHLLDANQKGCRAYMTMDCTKLIERMENYLWQQISQGQRAGEFTDKPENKDDHTVDAWGYVCLASKDVKWRDPNASPMASSVRYDAVTGAVVR